MSEKPLSELLDDLDCLYSNLNPYDLDSEEAFLEAIMYNWPRLSAELNKRVKV